MNRHTLKEDNQGVTSVEAVIAVAIVELLAAQADPGLMKACKQSQWQRIMNGFRKKDVPRGNSARMSVLRTGLGSPQVGKRTERSHPR
jgi:hypothetical protein